MGASWIGQGFSGEPKQLTELMVKAIAHRGFALLNVFSPCVVFRGRDQYDDLRRHAAPLPDSYDPKKRIEAVLLLEEKKIPLPLGVIYEEERPTMEDHLASIQAQAREKGVPSLESLAERFLP
jgi:2-oxoglutarate ferredoxin oxidoreductase subunit beta